jgi:L-alanine-DL-glutamate epimerase-like enolase superfamily enzyme
MNLTAHTLDLTLTTPFRISRSVQTLAHNVLTRIDGDGVEGIGEAAPSGYYGERRESVFMATICSANASARLSINCWG